VVISSPFPVRKDFMPVANLVFQVRVTIMRGRRTLPALLREVRCFIFSTQIESLIYNICDKFLTSMRINYTFFNI
jgi:hypothetical protein